MANNITNDLNLIFRESQKVSVDWKHGFIHDVHLFTAMLNNNCLASPFLTNFDIEVWESKAKAMHPQDSTLKAKDSMPLTIKAERALKHSYRIAALNKETEINTVHILLAILSYDNEVTDVCSKAGIHICDIIQSYFSEPVKQLPPALKPIRKKLYNKTDRFFFAISGFFDSSGGKKKELKRLLINAQTLFMYKQYRDCIDVCVIALTLSPNDFKFSTLQAYSKIFLLQFEQALPLFEDLAVTNPDRPNIMATLSYAYSMMGNYAQAAKIYDELLLQHPGNAQYLNNRGFQLIREEKFEEAIPFLDKSIAADPEFAFPLNNLGFCKYKLGQKEEGLALIDKSLTLHKGNSYTYRNKGVIMMESGDKASAIANFELALKFGFTEDYGNEVQQYVTQINHL